MPLGIVKLPTRAAAWRTTAAALLLGLSGAAGAAGTDAAGGAGATTGPPERGRVELKRQNTARGTEDESTKTTLRFESFHAGAVRLLRLDLQFPDEKPSFGGSPFDPRLGDTKFRVGFRAFEADGKSFPSFVELSIPTADPASLGSGKYQLSAGLRMLAPVKLAVADAAAHEARFEAEIEQVVSIAGDSDRADINHTKLELTFYDRWRSSYTLKLKFKPSIDWAKDGDTGAVGEVEGGLYFSRHWRTWLMLGGRLWGPDGVGGTYDTRIELGLARTF
jgi:hypothetical protein